VAPDIVGEPLDGEAPELPACEPLAGRPLDAPEACEEPVVARPPLDPDEARAPLVDSVDAPLDADAIGSGAPTLPLLPAMSVPTSPPEQPLKTALTNAMCPTDQRNPIALYCARWRHTAVSKDGCSAKFFLLHNPVRTNPAQCDWTNRGRLTPRRQLYALRPTLSHLHGFARPQTRTYGPDGGQPMRSDPTANSS
jgi:hypothetical protein